MSEAGEQARVVIVGGGCGGLSVAARLRRERPGVAVTVVEPSERHYYQPLWTLVGGGDRPLSASVRPQASVMPAGVEWVKDRVTAVDPEASTVTLADGRALSWDWLVMAPGLQLDWNRVDGLAGRVGQDGICSNYSAETVESTWAAIRGLRAGKAVFTHPSTPIKCGGAPQKIMYLAADHFRRTGVADAIDITFGIATPKIFAVDRYARPLVEVAARYGIDVRYQHDLVAVRPDAREAVFRDLVSEAEVVLPYDMLHVTPPMSAPDFVKGGPLADAGGWIDVDPATLRHRAFERVFALGDASNLPTSKTGAAIRKQAPTVAENLIAAMDDREPTARYDGYTSCPLVTGYGKLILAEFDYDGNPQETFPFDQSKERWSMYQLKKHVLPQLYWQGMLKGRA